MERETEKQIEKQFDEIFARFTMLEFMLEVVMANQLSQVTPDHSRQAKEDLLRKLNMLQETAPENVRRMLAISAQATEMRRRFVEKVAAREKEIRAATATPAR